MHLIRPRRGTWRALACLVWAGLAWLSPVAAQDAPPKEVVAKDLHEEVVHIEVTVTDMHGREETMDMPITVFTPPGEGPFPLMVFNHGRAVDAKRATQGRARFEHLSRYFVDKGMVVMVPTRVGYWETYGDFDPEYSGKCGARRYDAMHRAVSDEVLATVAYARTRSDVDARRWLVGGVSVGGLTALATAARRPPGLVGVLNFSGGAGGNPETRPASPCDPQQLQQHWASMAPRAQAPSLWLYWDNDQFWGRDAPREWHRVWSAGGSEAQFVALPALPNADGHQGADLDMDHWLPVVDRFLGRLGLDQPAIVQRPPKVPGADVNDASQVPISAASRADGYTRFLKATLPRAFAVGNKGGWGYAYGDYATGRALGYCRRSGQRCTLYAVDNDVVWSPR